MKQFESTRQVERERERSRGERKSSCAHLRSKAVQLSFGSYQGSYLNPKDDSALFRNKPYWLIGSIFSLFFFLSLTSFTSFLPSFFWFLGLLQHSLTSKVRPRKYFEPKQKRTNGRKRIPQTQLLAELWQV